MNVHIRVLMWLLRAVFDIAVLVFAAYQLWVITEPEVMTPLVVAYMLVVLVTEGDLHGTS